MRREFSHDRTWRYSQCKRGWFLISIPSFLCLLSSIKHMLLPILYSNSTELETRTQGEAKNFDFGKTGRIMKHMFAEGSQEGIFMLPWPLFTSFLFLHHFVPVRSFLQHQNEDEREERGGKSFELIFRNGKKGEWLFDGFVCRAHVTHWTSFH